MCPVPLYLVADCPLCGSVTLVLWSLNLLKRSLSSWLNSIWSILEKTICPKHFILRCKAALCLGTPQLTLCCISPTALPPSTAYFILLIDSLVLLLQLRVTVQVTLLFVLSSVLALNSVWHPGSIWNSVSQFVRSIAGSSDCWSSRVTLAVLTTSKIHSLLAFWLSVKR